MSLYSIAAASLTTSDDRRRQPVVDRGQVARTLAFCLVLAVALVMLQHRAQVVAGSVAGPALAPVAADGAPGAEHS